ncbi:hypothetical protein HF1_07610 [Mycoplasma haemofelis str. Langford 1]|uniref:Uncharacterized protein n=1 Tax=Mycoplasma haemofelis (strain Langford 1) TaxID=941640 RepID=E8ZHZ8_MYCHL|nr:hypothetical protein HF1_07610 [Mycoplasma haemofelis str. Langford 1]
MSAVVKFIVVPAAGIGGTAGTVYMGSSLVNFSGISDEEDSIVETIKDKFSGSLMTSVRSTDKKWNTRLSKLKSEDKSKLDESLKAITTEKELKDWCDEVSISPFVSQDDSKTRGVQEEYKSIAYLTSEIKY